MVDDSHKRFIDRGNEPSNEIASVRARLSGSQVGQLGIRAGLHAAEIARQQLQSKPKESIRSPGSDQLKTGRDGNETTLPADKEPLQAGMETLADQPSVAHYPLPAGQLGIHTGKYVAYRAMGQEAQEGEISDVHTGNPGDLTYHLEVTQRGGANQSDTTIYTTSGMLPTLHSTILEGIAMGQEAQEGEISDVHTDHPGGLTYRYEVTQREGANQSDTTIYTTSGMLPTLLHSTILEGMLDSNRSDQS